LEKQAATLALLGGDKDASRRHLAVYVARAPSDDTALQMLADLHKDAGALEPLAEVLAARAELSEGREKAKHLTELGLLLAGPLSRPAEAAAVLEDAAEADGENEAALAALLSPAVK